MGRDIELQLSAEAMRVIQSRIATGEFRSPAEVVEEALRLLDLLPAEEDEDLWDDTAEDGPPLGPVAEPDLDAFRQSLLPGAPLRLV